MKYSPITWDLLMEKRMNSIGQCQNAFKSYVGSKGVLTRVLAVEGCDAFYWDYMAQYFLNDEDNRKWNSRNYQNREGIKGANLFFDLYGDPEKASLVDKIVKQALK